MQDTNYPVAYWGKSWDEVTQYGEDADSEGVQGVANIIDNVPILHASLGELLPVPPAKPTESPLPKPEYLYGYSKFGDYFALRDPCLMNTKSSLHGAYEQNIKGIFLFAGKKQFDPSEAVTQAYVETTGLKEWIGEIPIEEELPSEKSLSYLVDVDTKHTEHIIFEDNNYRIKIEHIIKPSMLSAAGLSIDHNCQMNITFKSEKHFDETVKVIEELADFFTLCQGFYAGIESLELKFSDCSTPVKCLSSFPESCLDTNKVYRMPFPYSTIKGNLETMLQGWLYMSEDRKHAEVILASLMSDNWNMPFDLVFISLSQVLEVLSKANVDLKAMPDEKHRSYKNLILEGITNKEVKDWLEPRFPPNQKGQKRLLTELLKTHKTLIQWLIPDKDKFIDNQVNKRNRTIHITADSKGERDELNYESLYWHANAVRFVCYGVSFALLGLKEGDIIDALQDSWFEYMIARVRNFYKR